MIKYFLMDKELKVSIILGIFIFSFASLWFVYEYEQGKNLKTFIVVGEGEEKVSANIAEVRIGLITEDKDLNELQRENSEKMNNIIKFLKSQNIDAKDIQTENYSINPKYSYETSSYRIIGYTINQNISVKIRDLSKVGEILTKAVSYGANNVWGPNFVIDNEKIYLEKAREKAIIDAKEKAKKIAKIAGFKLGRIINININDEYSPLPSPIQLKSTSEIINVSSPQIEPGIQEIKARVSITYEIK